ncbi:hypothetical protein ACLB1T_05105 [Escherichia coli]
MRTPCECAGNVNDGAERAGYRNSRLNNDEHAWDAVVEEFDGYRQIWRKRGVMPMLRALMSARNIAEKLAGNGRR